MKIGANEIKPGVVLELDGKLFIDRLSPIKKEVVRKKLRKERAERESMEDEFPPPRRPKKKGF